jgi:hypothetical protein
MANIVNAYEPRVSVEDAKKGLQGAKNVLLSDKSLAKYQVDANNSNTFYGSPSWLGEDGKPLPDYMYNETAVIVRSKVTI